MFSSSFVSSAAFVELTGTTRFVIDAYSADPTSRHAGVVPPITFGVLLMEYSLLPGSSRSGENTRNTSLPTSNPIDSRRGLISSSVVPGYVVLSKQMSWPGRRKGSIPSSDSMTNDRSGPRSRLSGVGRHRIITSVSPAVSYTHLRAHETD